jgi:xanthine/uracil permease
MQQSKDSPSLGELFIELTRQMTTLVRQELAIATAAMTQKATRVGHDIGILAIGGAILYAGFLAILAAVIMGLTTVLPAWLSALVVGLVVAGVGLFLVQKERAALSREDLAPRQTLDTLKENAEWAKDQTK